VDKIAALVGKVQQHQVCSYNLVGTWVLPGQNVVVASIKLPFENISIQY